MGGGGSKLRKHLRRGDEYAALQICARHQQLSKSQQPILIGQEGKERAD